MEGVAGQVVGELGHEGDRLAVQEGDLLGAVLVDHVAVGHLQRLGVDQVDLLLARPPFALGDLDRDAGGVHAVADRPDQALFLGGLEDVVVLDVPAGVLEVAVALLPCLVVGFVEEVELQLRRHLGDPALVGQARFSCLRRMARGEWGMSS